MQRLLLILLLVGCRQAPSPVDAHAPVDVDNLVVGGSSSLAIANASNKTTSVHVAFGADSVVLPPAWAICKPSSALNCSFDLAAGATQTLALAGKYLNVSIAFDAQVGCGSTKAELNLNNPAWFDTADLSLVDGFNRNLQATLGAQQLGPTQGSAGNASALGVFPLGCDICVARQSPSCGIAPSPTPGSAGCKQGTQYAPDVPCQLQGVVKGGGSAVVVTLLP